MNDSKKILTLCLIHQHSRVLLGLKKRGFGAGRWNGFGGKLVPGETVEAAAKRELYEEAGIGVHGLDKVGVLDFEFQGNPEILQVHIFRAVVFSGEPTESEEMRPQWFAIDEIPYDEMWPDDRYWLPLLLSGKKFRGRFLFGDENAIIRQELSEVENFVLADCAN